MRVIDNIYGQIEIPNWLRGVILSPEVQRLKDVRLINTSSHTIPALSDVKRFTHSMGVVYLALRLKNRISAQYSNQELKAFLVAAAVHDIGTPAFGHLFEYQLSAMTEWDHESFVEDILKGTYRPEKKYHQLYYGNSINLSESLEKIGINANLVVDYIRGKGHLGKYLADSIDLDNIDNVFRMAAHLGLWAPGKEPIELVDSISSHGAEVKFNENSLKNLMKWKELRKHSYYILNFDESTLSGQAMLTDCISEAIRNDIIGLEHWFYTDEKLLQRLSDTLEELETKRTLKRFVIGDFYDTLFIGWYDSVDTTKSLQDPQARKELSNTLTERVELKCSPYVFYDIGAFSKEVKFKSKKNLFEKRVELLEKQSQSTIVGVFTPNRINDSRIKRYHNAIINVLEDFGLCHKDLLEKPTLKEFNGFSSQEKLYP